MADLYPNYDETTASRIVRWHPSKLYAELAIFDPPASFAGTPRPVYVFRPGGARQARRDFRIGAAAIEVSPGVYEHTLPGMLTEELGAYVVIVSTPPGGIDFAAAEEPGQEYAPECFLSLSMAKAFLRANVANPAVVGSVHTMSPERRHWLAGGTSAGFWEQLGSEMIPAGDLAELVDAAAARGGGRFRYSHDHTCGHLLGAIGQNRLSAFCEYVINPALAGVPGAYVANGSNPAGAVVLGVTGEAATLKRANRLQVTTSSSYTVNGAQSTGTTALAVQGSAAPMPAGCRVRLTADVSGSPTVYEFVVGADFAGGTGTIDARAWSSPTVGTIANGAALEVVQEFAVRTDYAGGTGSVAIWPSVQFPVQPGSAVELLHPSGEAYGAHSWAVGYTGTASMGRVWRSDDLSGVGVPLEEKRDADADRLLRADNPRAFELNLLAVGSFGNGLQRVDTLTAERSFWLRRNVATPTPLPEFVDLHDTGDMAHWLHEAYLLRLAAGRNVAGLGAYLGDRRDNPTGTGAVPANQPWLLGRYGTYDPQVAKAWLTDPARFGGAFA